MVEKAIKRFSIRFRMEDDTGTAIFEAPDFEVQKILRFRAADLICLEEEHGKHAVEEALLTFFTVEIDYGPTIHKFNMNQNVKEIYTVTRMTYTQNTTTDFEI
ncbi:hypothetical protein MKW98_016711 [Papaver atlanticum]|uniref:Uncharacterized protein n=1 Tax=Papaver atlanticum TaxID=357466 RepID=A0AAD4T422_9MAGN|nr:hypothetical protein MKW98_016711 [Papaver atlanticum]